MVGDGAISFAGAEGAGEAAEVVNGGPAAEGAQVAQAPQTIDGAVTPDQAAGGEVVTAQEQTPVAAQVRHCLRFRYSLLASSTHKLLRTLRCCKAWASNVCPKTKFDMYNRKSDKIFRLASQPQIP